MLRLIAGLRDLALEDGRVFVCGPGRGTNQEMTDLVRCYAPEAAIEIGDFLTEGQITVLHRSYSSCEVRRLENTIAFPTTSAVMHWWSNHNSYFPEIRDALAAELDAHFQDHDRFPMTKNVLGVLCRV